LGLLFFSATGLTQTFSGTPQALIQEHVSFGLPSTGELLFREGYILSHNNWLKIPNWVAYHLDFKNLQTGLKRKDYFRVTTQVLRRSGHEQLSAGLTG